MVPIKHCFEALNADPIAYMDTKIATTCYVFR